MAAQEDAAVMDSALKMVVSGLAGVMKDGEVTIAAFHKKQTATMKSTMMLV